MAWALALWALAVAGIDLAQRRIPNALILAALLPALVLLALRGEGLLQAGLASSLLGLGGGLLLLVPAYAAGWLGAGDVKLASCLGLLLGAAGLTVCLVVAAVALGLMSAAHLLWHRVRRAAPESRRRTVPAAPALTAGFLVALLLGTVG